MMKLKFLLMLLLLSIRTNPQSNNIDALIPPQGFDIRLLNSKGTSAIVNDVANLGQMNPAALTNFENHSIGFSYQYSSDITEGWINNSKVSRQNDLIPQSAGAIYKLDNLSFGVG